MNRFGRTLVHMSIYQLRDLFRNKIAFFFNLIFPLILVVLFGTLFRAPDPSVVTPIGVANGDSAWAGAALTNALGSIESFRVIEGTQEDLNASLQSGQIRALIVIPANASAAIEGAADSDGPGRAADAAKEPGASTSVSESASTSTAAPSTITILFDPMSPASGQAAGELRTIVDAVALQMQGARPALAARLETVEGSVKRDVFDYLMPGQMTIMLLSAGLFTVGISVAAQRQTGALRHLFSTPLPVGVWGMARIGANLVMALFQAVVLFAFAAAVYGVAPPANLGGTVVTVAVSALATLGLGLLIGTLVKGEDRALAVIMPLYMAMLFLSNAAMPLEDPPAVIAAMQPFVPAYHMTEALRAVMRDGLPLRAVGGELLILGAVAAVTLGLSLVRIRRQYVTV